MTRKSRDERHDVAFMVGAVVGGLTAATVALFQAPQSGARTRAGMARAMDQIGPNATKALASARTSLTAATRGTGGTAGQARQRAAETLASAGRLLPGRERVDTSGASRQTDQLRAVDEVVANTPSGARLAAPTGPLAARPYGDVPTDPAGRPAASAAEAAALLEAATRRGGERGPFGAAVDRVIDGPRPANMSPDR